MFNKDYKLVLLAAKDKVKFFKRNPQGYCISSVLAGIYIGFGVLLLCSVGGLLEGQAHARIIMGVFFGIALSLVIIAGAELFTGNIFILSAGLFKRKITLKNAAILLAVCFLGNWAGALLLAGIFNAAGFSNMSTGWFIASTALAKVNIPFFPLFLRAVLCNTLVCLAVWCSFKCKSESGKIIMIFCCISAFVICNFEHSIANMTLLSLALFLPSGAAIGIGDYFYNLLAVALGNITGGLLCVALPYFIISKKKKRRVRQESSIE